MSKIPMKEVVKGVKGIGKFIKDNPKEAAILGGGIVKGIKQVGDLKKEKDEKKNSFNEIKNMQKENLNQYKNIILNELDTKNRLELHQLKLEIEGFISHIQVVEKSKNFVKRQMSLRKSKEWEDLLKQVENKIKVKDYNNYLRYFNNRNFKTNYFEGFENHLNKFIGLCEVGNNEEIVRFICSQTNRDKETVEQDFIL